MFQGMDAFHFQVEIPDDELSIQGDYFEMHKIPESNIFIIVKESDYTGYTECPCSPGNVS